MFQVEGGAVVWAKMGDKEFTAVYVEGVGVAVRSCTFERFEPFDGTVDLLISDVLEGGAWEGVVKVWVNPVVLWGREKE
jgi:hypothetical protein